MTWSAESTLTDGPVVRGVLRGADSHSQQLDLVAVDAAYPVPVCSDEDRRGAHQAWQFGQVQLIDVDGRVGAAVPGSAFDANLACEAVSRVAKAVGASAARFTVLIAL